MKRYLVQLAEVYEHQNVGGWLMSEKLDGMRAYWDGGISRHLPCAQVPWANTIKDHVRLSQQISTGLWSRGGKMIPAPDEWLDSLPAMPFDGELYLGRGQFQQVMSTCKAADRDWTDVQYKVYGSPPPVDQFRSGEICFNGKEKMWMGIEGMEFFNAHMGFDKADIAGGRLRDLGTLTMALTIEHPVHIVHQEQLPLRRIDFEERIAERLEEVQSAGGEGLMLANPAARWEPVRSKNLLKVKGYLDDEAEVVGYVWGRKTDRGSKLANLMGQLRVVWNGNNFGLSGFNNEERVLHYDNLPTAFEDWKPGELVNDRIHSLQFPIGSKVRFKYRELTDDGIPKEGRYFR